MSPTGSDKPAPPLAYATIRPTVAASPPTSQHPHAALRLRAGPLSLVFEPETALVRDVRLGDREVLRGVYAAVRDTDWNTISPQVSDVRLDEKPEAFALSFQARVVEGDIDFAWRGRLTGTKEGTLSFELDGEARTSFRSNRVGFCVLHPAGVAGQACSVEHAEGEVEDARFPELIAPHQPFFDVRAITHEPAPGITAMVRCEGDVFETEDQRNWTDASFKTYCRPLARPFPFEVAAGTRVRQSVELSLHGLETMADVEAEQGDAVPVRVDVGEAVGTVAPVGIGIARTSARLDDEALERLRALRPAHLRADLAFSSPDVEAVFGAACDGARTLGVPLELALFLSENAEADLARLHRLLEEKKPEVRAWLVFHEGDATTQARWARLARTHLESYAPDARFLGGSYSNFTELNRERPDPKTLDGLVYAVNPQVHAFDSRSMTETWEGQAMTVESAQAFADGRPVYVGPVTLKPQRSPTAPEEKPEPGAMPATVDVRQATRFGAAWTLGSVQHLMQAGAAGLTYFEAAGPHGVLAPQDAPPPDAFPAEPGTVFPLYHVLADVGAWRGRPLLQTVVSAPLAVAALAVQEEGGIGLLLANATPEPQRVEVRLPRPCSKATVRALDAETEREATHRPEAFRDRAGRPAPVEGNLLLLELPPHGYFWIAITD